MNYIRKIPFLTLLPILSLVGLSVIMLATVFLQAKTYGVTVDEPLQDNYGHILLAWYTSFGKNTSFLTAYPGEFMPEHGAIFDTFVALVQHFVGNEWYTRAVLTALAGVSGVIAIALCGYELAGWWGALIAALGLWLYPRYFGAIFNNPKDVPFTAAMIWLFWSTLLLVKRWSAGKKYIWNCLLVGFFIGLAASIRVTAIIWLGVLGLLLAGWWLFNGLQTWKKKKLLPILGTQIFVCVTIGLTSLLTMMVCWPYIFLNPIHNLYDSILIMQKYPYNAGILFDNGIYPAIKLPRSYVPTWLVIGSPPTLVVFTLVGLAAAFLIALKKRVIEPRVATMLLAFLVPLASLIILRPVLYDTLRQFLFIVPPMILLAAYGIIQLYHFLINHKQKLFAITMVTLIIVSYGLLILRMVELHPYEYVYFSPIAGPLKILNQGYQVDYWGTCDKEAGEWVARNYKRYTNKANPTMEGVPGWEFLSQMYLPSNFQVDSQNPDFYIVLYGGNNFNKFPTYKIIYTVSREDTVFCIVKINPNTQNSK